METDYCGIASGSEVDKVKVCKFKVFYGNLKNTPLIEQCPINRERGRLPNKESRGKIQKT